MKKFSPKIFDGLAVAVLVITVLSIWLGLSGTASIPLDVTKNAGVRVEVQRYMGYEILPVRYLSLPYDLTVNSNEQVQLLDIGMLLLIFVPIALLLGFKFKPLMQISVILSSLFLLVISTANGVIIGQDIKPIAAGLPALEQYLQSTTFSDAPVGVIMAGFYKFFVTAYSGIYNGLSMISGEQDAITYPLLLLVFLLFFIVTWKRITGKDEWMKGFSVFLYVYLFFYLILSAGIVWYGLIVFPLLTLLVFKSLSNVSKQRDLLEKVSLYSFYFVVASWILMGLVNRISNIHLNAMNSSKFVGKRLYDPAYVKYNTGLYSSKQVVDAFYPNLYNAAELINQETNSLIYNVGTRFSFFIKENDKRVFKDSQLDFFNQLYSKYSESGQVIPMLKASGFRYIMVDFNTPTLDNTPEKTLINRYNTFMNFLVNDPSIELVSTSRLVKVESEGKVTTQFGLFGDIQIPGTYAVFKII